MRLAREFIFGCLKFYVSILTPSPRLRIPKPIDWTDGNP